MPKIYNDATMQLVWEAVTNEKKPMKLIAVELSTEMAVVNRIYEAAKKRFGKSDARKLVGKSKSLPTVVQKFQRPPAVYSNRSPYGIASPGINN